MVRTDRLRPASNCTVNKNGPAKNSQRLLAERPKKCTLEWLSSRGQRVIPRVKVRNIEDPVVRARQHIALQRDFSEFCGREIPWVFDWVQSQVWSVDAVRIFCYRVVTERLFYP